MERKIQQLDGMAAAVIDSCSLGDVIVDFCSGGGHLGIVVRIRAALILFFPPTQFSCHGHLISELINVLFVACSFAARLSGDYGG